MIIKQHHVINLNILRRFNGKKVHFAIPVSNNIFKQMLKAGFSKNIEVGETILPSIIGSATRYNAEGFFIKHKDREKEICYRTVEWTWQQWTGYKETKEVTEFRDVSYERWQRTYFPPLSVELTIIENNLKDKIIISPAFIIDVENDSVILKNTINLFLELFGECHVIDTSLNDIIIPKQIRLNWNILPQGKLPWEKRYEQIKPFIDKAKSGNKAFVSYRLERINSYGADFVATGLNGFNGYLIYGFTKKSLFIFESTQVNNATYVFEKDWQEISKLTKKDILDAKLQKERIIHRINAWDTKIEKLLK